MLIDTHAHLTDPVYRGAEDIIRHMKRDGLERIICVGYNEFSSVYAARIAEAHADVSAAVGVHPSDAARAGSSYLDTLESLVDSHKVVAIGEVGLDYHYEDTDKPAQKRALVEQMALAKKHGLPLCFHVRDAYGDFLEIVRAHRDCLRYGAVMHCYSGSLETAKICLDMGMYISFSGSITFKNSKLGEVAAYMPLDRILIETDCPYLAPMPHRGETNYPRYVAYQAEKVAEVRGITRAEVEKATCENAYRLFPRMRIDADIPF